MLYNTTLLFLQLSSISSGSALFSPSSLSTPTYYSFSHLKLSKHFSTFLSISGNNVNSAVHYSQFANFLDSVVSISTVELSGRRNQRDNAENPAESFNCTSCVYLNNTATFAGAAILVSAIDLTGNIQSSEFRNNRALMGGAVFFSSRSFNCNYSSFRQNFANIGSHIFVKADQLYMFSSSFQEANASQSCAEFVLSTAVNGFTMNSCNFFQNESPLHAVGVSVTLESCCVMLYDNTGYDNYIYNQSFSASDGGSFILQNSVVNIYSVSGTFNSANINIPTTGDTAVPMCRLIPSPSATSNEGWGSLSAILSLVAIAFFVLISIIGIFIVTCHKKEEEDDKSESEKPLNQKQ